MAESCNNYLVITGESNDVILTKILNEDGVVDFDVLLPIPENVTDLIKPPSACESGHYEGERDWTWHNRGCPGNARYTEIDELADDGGVQIGFETDWVAPSSWFNKLGSSVKIETADDTVPTTMVLNYTCHDSMFAGELVYEPNRHDGLHYNRVIYSGQQLSDELGVDINELPIDDKD